MKILISNDDGIRARGLLRLAVELSKKHEITVYAPATEQSCKSHAINFFSPVPLKKYSYEEVLGFDDFSSEEKELIKKIEFYHVEGTPCDAVKLGLNLMENAGGHPDLVISGINNSMNLGTDCIYSGTVNGAIEGAVSRVKAFAVSLECEKNDYDFAVEFVAKNLQKFYELLPDYRTIFNINIPFSKREKIRGAVFATTGDRIFDDAYQYIKDKGFLVTGRPVAVPNEDTADVVKAEEGYICVAPVKVAFTDKELFEKIKNERIEF